MKEEEKKLIKEFIDGSPEYIEMLKKCSDNTCPICGMKAESYEKLVEEVKKLINNSNN